MTKHFGYQLENLSASQILDVRASTPEMEAEQAMSILGYVPQAKVIREPPPSNDDIVGATKRVYNEYYEIVDAFIEEGGQLLRRPDRAESLHALKGFNWNGLRHGQGDPRNVIAKLRNDPMLADAYRQVADTPQMITTSLGIAVSAQLGLGGEGGIGGVHTVIKQPDGSQIKGTAWLAAKLGIAIEFSVGLQVGLYFVELDKYAGGFLGAAVAGDIALGGSFAALFSPDLRTFYGFSIGIGVGFGAAVTLMGGYTFVF